MSTLRTLVTSTGPIATITGPVRREIGLIRYARTVYKRIPEPPEETLWQLGLYAVIAAIGLAALFAPSHILVSSLQYAGLLILGLPLLLGSVIAAIGLMAPLLLVEWGGIALTLAGFVAYGYGVLAGAASVTGPLVAAALVLTLVKRLRFLTRRHRHVRALQREAAATAAR